MKDYGKFSYIVVGAGAAGCDRLPARRSDAARFRRECVARAAHAPDGGEGLCRGAAGRSG